MRGECACEACDVSAGGGARALRERGSLTAGEGIPVCEKGGRGTAGGGGGAGGGDDVVRAPRGSGQFLASGRPDLLGWAGGPFPCGGDIVLDKASRL